MNAQLQDVLEHYPLPSIQHISPLSEGLIHKTYLIETNDGNFILQQLHPLLSSEAIGADIQAVTEHLADQQFYAAQLVQNTDGQTRTMIGEDVWRMQTALPGQTHEVVKSKDMAREAGSMLARFHKAIRDIEHDFQTDVILHETEKEYEALLAAAKNHPGLLLEVKEEYDFLIEELPKLFLPDHLPKHVVHGDPKISNILFDGFENAISIIDLDTCHHGTVLCDLGDAMRSWCGGKEDDPKNCFKDDVFLSAIEGYLDDAHFLSNEEVSLIPQAVAAITLELAARFLADYFNDNYFGWDEKRYKSRRDHNLARCRGQIAQYKDFKTKMGW